MEGIPEIDWSAYDLPTKLSWVMNGSSGAIATPTRQSLTALSTRLSSFDTSLQMLAHTTSGDWQGAAGDKAAAGLQKSAQNSAETSEAHARGSASVNSYGGSYDGMSATLHSRQQPDETWWTDVQDFFGVQTDYKAWVDRRNEIEQEVDKALKAYESDARTALAGFTPSTPTAPVVADPGTPDESGTAALRKASPGGGGGGGTGGAGIPSVHGGGGTAGAGDQQAGGQGGGGGRVSPVPGIGAGRGGSGQNGDGPGAGIGPTGSGGGSGAGQVTAPPAWTSTAGVATPDAPSIPHPYAPQATGPSSPAPSIPTPYAPSGMDPPGGGGTAAWDGGGAGGRGATRVSTGTEFGERLPRAAQPALDESPSAQRQAPAAESRAAAARPGAGGSATPMMGGGGGAGGNDRTRQARYVIPSSAPFAVPLPPYPDGLIIPDDDDEW